MRLTVLGGSAASPNPGMGCAGLLLQTGLLPLGVGIAGGLAGAALVARAMGGLLYGIGSFDLPAFAAAVVALAMVTLAAGAIPARRVARIDPLTALRTD